MRTIYTWALPEVVENLVDSSDVYRVYVYALIAFSLSRWTTELQRFVEKANKLSTSSKVEIEQTAIGFLKINEERDIARIDAQVAGMPEHLKRLAAVAAQNFLASGWAFKILEKSNASADSFDSLQLLAVVHSHSERFANIDFRIDTSWRQWDSAVEFMQLKLHSHEMNLCLLDKAFVQWHFQKFYTSSVEGEPDGFWANVSGLMEIPQEIISWSAPSAKAHAHVLIRCPRTIDFEAVRRMVPSDVSYSAEFFKKLSKQQAPGQL